MQDKFSQLILYIQSNLKNKNAKREELSQEKEKVTESLTQLEAEIESDETLLSSREQESSNYRHYHLKVLGRTLYIVYTIMLELLMLAVCSEVALCFWVDVLTTITIPKIILGVALTLGDVFIVVSATKSIFGAAKYSVESIKKLYQNRKKYKSDDEIQSQIKSIKERLENLRKELNSKKDEEKDLNKTLQELYTEISILEGKLTETKDAFIESTIRIHDVGVEEQLNIDFDRLHYGKEPKELCEESGKCLIIKKREN